MEVSKILEHALYFRRILTDVLDEIIKGFWCRIYALVERPSSNKR